MEQRERWRAGNPWLNELLEEEEGKKLGRRGESEPRGSFWISSQRGAVWHRMSASETQWRIWDRDEPLYIVLGPEYAF